MDKYEFNLKVEQLKKMVKAGDYDTAMKIADEIDWRRVSSVSLLSMVSEVYEKKNDIEEAREILLLAYDRAPVGKRILYKLTLLSLQLNDIAEAETFYKEFYKVAPDDPRQHILRYLVLKAKGAPAAQLINSLEQYNLAEPNEHWMYELAETYYRAGRIQDCVRTCDELMLMFGIGSYVDKAVELKTQRCGQPLTEYQMNLISKRDSYENSPVSQETMVLETPLRQEETAAEISEDDMDAEIAAHMAQLDHELDNPLPARQTGFGFGAQPGFGTQAGFGAQQGFGTQAGFGAQQEFGTQQGFGFEAQPVPQPEMQPMPAVPMPGIAAAQAGFGFEPKSEFQPGFESEPQPMSQPGFGFEPKSEFQPTPDTASAQQPAMNTAPAQQPKTSTASAQQPAMDEEKAGARSSDSKPTYTVNFLIERRTPDSGLEAAKRLLRLMHEHTGSANKVAKVPAEKLNEMGIAAAAERLAGKDLIVTEAGDLTEASVNGIVMLIQREPESRVIAMIDNPIQLKKMLTKYPELLQLFHLDKEESTAPSRAQKMTEPVGGNTQPLPDVSPAQQPAYQSSSEPVYQPAPQQEMPPVVTPQQDYQGYPEQSAPGNPPAGGEVPYVSNVQRREKGADEMGVDEFVQVASEYAKDIDCAISGKSMLALYERAEIMEEDGIPLTKENAIALIEEAADRAEKPPIGKKLAGLFTPKYDKEDRLILREEHFVP